MKSYEPIVEFCIKIVENGEVYMSGAPYMVPVKLMKEFYDLVMEAINSLLDVGFIDDDQTLLLMAYRKKKELFVYKQFDWFMPLKGYGAGHLRTKDNNDGYKAKLKDRLLYRYRINKRNRRYLKGIKDIFLKDYLD